jgi:hypothetical protein
VNARRATRVLATLLAVAIALAVGVIGLWAVFSDFGPNESPTARWLIVGLIYAAGAAAVGALVPQRWYLALLTAWGPLAIGLLGLATRLRIGGPFPYWSFLALEILGVPGVALAFGYLGRKCRGLQAQ